jgi:uncharacterized membrane protein
MRISRRIWGWLVFSLGLLWFVGGIFGYFQGNWHMLLHIFLGVVLLRMGWNISHGIRDGAQETEAGAPRWNIVPRDESPK